MGPSPAIMRFKLLLLGTRYTCEGREVYLLSLKTEGVSLESSPERLRW